jgi:hypothetical protein
MNKITMSFIQFTIAVDKYISTRVGVGLGDLADVDIWDWYTEDAAPVSFWRLQVKEAAHFVMESQDCIDDDILALF